MGFIPERLTMMMVNNTLTILLIYQYCTPIFHLIGMPCIFNIILLLSDPGPTHSDKVISNHLRAAMVILATSWVSR